MRYFNKIKSILMFGFVFAPVVTFAAVSDLQSLIKLVKGIISSLVPLVMSLAVLAFIYGIFNYMRKSDDPKARVEGNQFIIWGIIALFVMVSLWALVGVIQGTFFGSGTSSIKHGTTDSGIKYYWDDSKIYYIDK